MSEGEALDRGELRVVSRAASRLALKCYTCGATAQINVSGDQEQDDVLKQHGWHSRMVDSLVECVQVEKMPEREVWICGRQHPTLDEMKGWRFSAQGNQLFFGSHEFPSMLINVAAFSSDMTQEDNDKAFNRCAVIAEQLNIIVGHDGILGEHDWPESMGCN